MVYIVTNFLAPIKKLNIETEDCQATMRSRQAAEVTENNGKGEDLIESV